MVMLTSFFTACAHKPGMRTDSGAALTAIEITPADPGVPKGASKQLVAGGIYSDRTRHDITSYVTWTSTDTSRALVNGSGLAKGMDRGTAIIKASLENISAHTTLTVIEPALVSLMVTPENPNSAWEPAKSFSALGAYSDGTSRNITSTVQWSSSDETIAGIVNPGGAPIWATRKGIGSTQITAADPVSGITGSTKLTSAIGIINGTLRGKPLDLTGRVTTIAGMAGASGAADGIGNAARFNNPFGITTDGTSLFVSDMYNHTVRKVEIATGTVTTLAGVPGSRGFSDGTGAVTMFSSPAGVASDGTNLYVIEFGNHAVRKVIITFGSVSTIAGNATIVGSADGVGAAATFGWPYGIVLSGDNLFIADTSNHAIRKLVVSTGAVTTLAGKAGVAGSNDGIGASARFNNPYSITTDGANLFVTDTNNHTIRKIVITTGAVSTIAGSSESSGYADDLGKAARFKGPAGITTDGVNLYVTDFGNNCIRRIVVATGAVSTIAGTAGAAGAIDGTGPEARFGWPNGITTDGTSLFVTDLGSNIIRRIQ